MADPITEAREWAEKKRKEAEAAVSSVTGGVVKAAQDIGGAVIDTATSIAKNAAGVTQLDESLGTLANGVTAVNTIGGIPSAILGSIGGGLSRTADDLATTLNLNNTNKFLNGYVNFLSGGIFGVDENGGIGMGATTRLLDEGIGELTGRNAQRQALGEQQAELERTRAAQQAEIAAENKRKEQIDVASSKAGGLARQSALSNYGVYGSGSSVSPLQNPSKDFMGL